MFNQKARRIRQLEAEAAAREAQPYLGIAQGIAQDMEAEVERLTKASKTTMGGAEVEAALARAISTVTEERRQQAARDVFNRFPVEKQWSILVNLFGDEPIIDALQAKRQETLARLNGTFNLDAFREEARDRGVIELNNVPAGTSIAFGLCSSTMGTEYRNKHENSFRVISGVMVEDGGIHILKDESIRGDNTPGPKQTSRRYGDHEIASFGIKIEKDGKSTFQPCIYIDAEVSAQVNGQVESTGLDLAWLELDGESVVR